MENLKERREPVEKDVVTFDVGQFMKKDMAQSIRGKLALESLGQQQCGKDAPEYGRRPNR